MNGEIFRPSKSALSYKGGKLAVTGYPFKVISGEKWDDLLKRIDFHRSYTINAGGGIRCEVFVHSMEEQKIIQPRFWVRVHMGCDIFDIFAAHFEEFVSVLEKFSTIITADVAGAIAERKDR